MSRQDNRILLLNFKVYLTEEGHVELKKENLTAEQWCEVVEECFPEYENKTLIENFINYLNDNTNKLYTAISKYF
jgi:hypothetical protein|tara:strand:+ start:2512 stop:2736 length:225 start_codon:yes stop_codon:yes gene_type:complete